MRYQLPKEIPGIPEHTLAGLQRYIEQGIPTGGFLNAVLSNDLRESFQRADLENQRCMFAIVRFLYMQAPAECWGSSEKVDAWTRKHAEERMQATQVKLSGVPNV